MTETTNTTHYATATDRANAAHEVEDLVNVASNGRAQRDDGKFISDHQLQQIEANADQIRDGLNNLEKNRNEVILGEMAKNIDVLEKENQKKEATDKTQNDEISQLKEENKRLKAEIAGFNVLEDRVRALEQGSSSSKDKSEDDAVAVEAKEKQSEEALKPGDRVRYKDRDGNEVEGVLESVSDLANEEAVVYRVKTKDGKSIDVSYAYRITPEANTKEPLELSKELEGKIFEAATLYARETAKTRKTYWGYLLKTSKRWVKIPGVKWLADKISDKVDDNIENARKEYEQSTEKQMCEEIDKYFEKIFTKEQRETEQIAEAINQAKFAYLEFAEVGLAALIQQKSTEISGQAGKFTEFFITRKGAKGRIQRYASMALIGAAAGGVALLSGLAIPGVLAAGGMAGLATARSVTHRRANAVVDKDSLKTVADVRYEEELARIRSILSSGLTPEEATKHLSRARIKSTAGITRETRELQNSSTVAGKAGAAVVVGAVHAAGALFGGGNPTDTLTVPRDPTPGPNSASGTFPIEQASSYTNELMQFGESTGHPIPPSVAFELHNELLGRFGNYIIDPSTGNPVGTYFRGIAGPGDIGISAPGTGQLAPGVENYINSWFAARGL